QRRREIMEMGHDKPPHLALAARLAARIEHLDDEVLCHDVIEPAVGTFDGEVAELLRGLSVFDLALEQRSRGLAQLGWQGLAGGADVADRRRGDAVRAAI